jgi:hypothetical protein
MRNEIPFFKFGNSVRFSKKHIDEWLEGHRRELRGKQAASDTGNGDGGKLFAGEKE